MMICPNCSSENEDHYKFCLACGTELSREKAAPAKIEPSEPEAPIVARKPRLSGLQERLDAIREFRESTSPKAAQPEADAIGQRSSTGWTMPPSNGPQPVSPSDGFPSVAELKEPTEEPGLVEDVQQDDNRLGHPEGRGHQGVVPDASPDNLEADSTNDAATDEPVPSDELSTPAFSPATASAKPEPVDGVSVSLDESDERGENALSDAAKDEPSDDHPRKIDNDAANVVSVIIDDVLQPEPASDTDLQSTLALQESLVASVTDDGLNRDQTIADDQVPASDGHAVEEDLETEAQPVIDSAALSSNQRLETQLEAPPDALRDALTRIPSDHERYQDTGAPPIESSIAPSKDAMPSHDEMDSGSFRGDKRAEHIDIAAPPASPAERTCANCGAHVPKSFRFCGACGKEFVDVSSIDAEALKQVAIGELILIHPDGSEGEHFSLRDGNIVIGRNSPVALFSNDPFLSPKHAKFSYTNGWLTIQDLESYNGVFIRLRAEVRVNSGDYFRLGQQLLMFENARGVVDAARPTADGTMVGGSPSSGIWGRIRQVYAVDTCLGEWTLTTPEIYIGRERGTITFTNDIFISSSHCRLRRGDGFAYLADLGSTNGTYVRLKDETALSSGDLILLGQQLFRVHLRADNEN